ncbi:MAG: SGNH/GDSL hydrolase family protein [Burkholderiales bacterium]|nr:SGNH/GDSL hydrolase family protein [Burkholderiales bacterium]
MKARWLLTTLFCTAMGLAHAADPQDWAGLRHFQADNGALVPAARQTRRVVFMGDSITEGWSNSRASVFTSPARINRGISGQTTPQMVLRFRQDVIALRPRAVVILAGTNDIAGNTGPATLEEIEGNIASMAELARSHGIRVVLCAVLPAKRYPWAPELLPAPRIVALNAWIKDYATRNRLGFVDFHGALADAEQGLGLEYSGDGVHPNDAGYAVMQRLIEPALARALR